MIYGAATKLDAAGARSSFCLSVSPVPEEQDVDGRRERGPRVREREGESESESEGKQGVKANGCRGYVTVLSLGVAREQSRGESSVEAGGERKIKDR